MFLATTPTPQTIPTALPTASGTRCGVSYNIPSREPTLDIYTSAFAEFPWMLALLDATALSPDGSIIRNAFVCGGSLLSKDIAMTAAHCVKE